ncbi:MAG TPA: hypothetical protein VHF22_11840, partial [Planctomycetota bacterium]|nr:hypothetical protein [Planctomycetota bacterium]
NFGDAQLYADPLLQGAPVDLRNFQLSQPVVGIAATKTGYGYWLVEADGRVQNFGDAGFYSYTGSRSLNAPVVSITRSFAGAGYWLLSEDGTVFALGDAVDCGSRPR